MDYYAAAMEGGWHWLYSEALPSIANGDVTPFANAPDGTRMVMLTFSGGDIYYTYNGSTATLVDSQAHKIYSTTPERVFLVDLHQLKEIKMLQSGGVVIGYITYIGVK